MTDRVLIVTARYPILGEVKSRIAAEIGHEQALKVYQKLLDRCLSTIAGCECLKYIFFTGTDDPQTRKQVAELGCGIEPQSEGDIGRRMMDAFDRVWRMHPDAHVVLVGTDVPDLRSEIIERAFAQLEDHDAVIGPATDGGYYLIGLRRPLPEVFIGPEWGMPSVCANTVSILEASQQRIGWVDELSDIDYLADLFESVHFPEYTNTP